MRLPGNQRATRSGPCQGFPQQVSPSAGRTGRHSSMKPIVYIALSQFCEKDQGPIRRLVAAGCDVRRNTLGRRLKYEEVVPAIGEADAVIAGVEPYDASILKALSRVRCISRCGVGTDAIDLEAAARRGIIVLNTPD